MTDLLLAAETASGRSTTGWGIFGLMIAVLLGALVYINLRTVLGIIARATTKEAIRQPVFSLLLFIGLALLVANTFVPFFTFGEDVKMLKDCGLATILISGLMLAVWTASMSISGEIEGKTAMTLLSKPINRRQFVLGKYIGIVQAVLWLMLPLVLAFLTLIYYKVGYDAKEASKDVPAWFIYSSVAGIRIPLLYGVRLEAVLQILPGILLILMEAAVLTAVSVAISTRLPMIFNIVTCFTIFVIGHLTPSLVQQDIVQLEPVVFMARLIATMLPSLEVFNMQAAVATGIVVPPDYLGFSLLYCCAYSAAAILLAFILFEDRDLA